MKKLNLYTVIYILIGIVLVVLAIATTDMGLSQKDKSIYDKAVEINKKVNGLGFVNFDINKYKVRFFDGKNDYVVYGSEIKKEAPAMETFVGTTVEVDGEFQVLLPTYDKFSQMFNVLSVAGNISEGSFSFEESDYNESSHIATLCHEAFHTWQFTGNYDSIERMVKEAGIPENVNYSDIILNEVDCNQELVLLFEEEINVLQQALEQDDIEEKKKLVMQALSINANREKLLSPQAKFVEKYYETFEGSARYVEAGIYRELEGEEKWAKTYRIPFEYKNGSGKYYEIGMIKCMLLDQLNPKWKNEFGLDKGFDVLLSEVE